MFLHLFSLETLEPHPRAKKPILEWPDTLAIPRIELGFQICDDGLFVLKHHRQLGPQNDKLYGWQWTTGRLGVVSITLSDRWCVDDSVWVSQTEYCPTNRLFSSHPLRLSFLPLPPD